HARSAGKPEVRGGLSGLSVPAVRLGETGAGLVKEARLESAGPDALLNIVLEGPAGDVKTASLQDPFRVVVDIYRPKESAGTDVQRGRNGGGATPLKMIVLDPGHGGHDPVAKAPNRRQQKTLAPDLTSRPAPTSANSPTP